MNCGIAYWSILWFSLILATDATAEECYTHYIGTAEGAKLLCFNVKDTAVYNESLANNVTQIELFRTEVSDMNWNFFSEKFPLNGGIASLALSHGNLSRISDDNFAAFKELSHLNLSFNRISVVAERAFAANVKLRSISLVSNEIEQLKAGTFGTLVDLESVDLTRNRLKALHKYLFSNNARLVSLDVKFNRLKEISGVMFHALPALESLDLSCNRIEVIPPHVFKYNYALKRLNLRGNDIKLLDYAFVHLGLSELNLLENPLDMNDEKNRRVLKHLKMSGLTLETADHFHQTTDEQGDVRQADPAGEVVLKTSPQLKLVLAGMITSLIVITVLLCFLSYHVYQRSKQKLHDKYYHSSCRSIDYLQGEEQKCLRLSISEGNAFFHNCQTGTTQNNDDSKCSCTSCFSKNIDENI